MASFKRKQKNDMFDGRLISNRPSSAKIDDVGGHTEEEQ